MNRVRRRAVMVYSVAYVTRPHTKKERRGHIRFAADEAWALHSNYSKTRNPDEDQHSALIIGKLESLGAMRINLYHPFHGKNLTQLNSKNKFKVPNKGKVREVELILPKEVKECGTKEDPDH